MSYHVPEFDLDEFGPDPASSQSRPKNMPDDKIVELVWHKGQPVAQNQNQKLFRPPEIASTTHQVFMQEDEMTSWLHYPLDDDTSFDQHITDLLYHPPAPSAAPPPSSSARELTPPPPPPPPAPQRHQQLFRPQTRPPPHPSAAGVNFPQFALLKARVPESGPSASTTNNGLRELTVVDSSDTLKSSLFPVSSSAFKFSVGESMNDSDTIAGPSSAAGCGRDSLSSMDAETYACSGSGGSATNLKSTRPSAERKRKAFETADAFAAESEDLDIESYDGERQSRRTSSGKRSRAAEVHNLSERKRRDKINEKMKALQDLIPKCTKTDKASMLEEAIEYMKTLQMQLQMMSVGYYGMVPMVFPGVQQYMPMGMGMGMEMRMNQPMVPFPMQTPGASSSLGPRFPFPAFQTPPIPLFHPTSVQTNPVETIGNVNFPLNANVYQQYVGAEQMPQQHVFENPPPISTPSTSKASTSKEAEDNDKHPSHPG